MAVVILLLVPVGLVSASDTGADQGGTEWRSISKRTIRSLARKGNRVDLVESALALSPVKVTHREARETRAALDEIVTQIRLEVREGASASELVDALNRVLFGNRHYRGTLEPESADALSLRALVEGREGSCVGLVLLYLALAERLGLSLSAAATPEHLFVRMETGGGDVNLEMLEEGREVPDRTYRRRQPMDDTSVEQGIFMAPLSKQALLGYFISNRGALALRLGKPRLAESDLTAALDLAPRVPAAWYNRGLARLELDRPREAREDFNRSLDLHSHDPQALNNRGIAASRLGDLNAARIDFEAALALRPNMREAMENLRRVRAELGEGRGR